MSFIKNRTVIGVLCIVISLIICFVLTPLFTAGVSQKTTIVRVVKEIRPGDAIADDQVKVVEVGGHGLPENVIRDKESVVGRYAVTALDVGDYILPTKLSEAPAAENAYLYNLNGEKQAISITIKSFANGLSGKLMSGDIVSVIAPDFRKLGETVIPPELQFVEVISVTASSGYDANTGEASTGEDDDDRELPSTVTILVCPYQSMLLAELEADGKLHLSLVYRGDPEACAAFLTTQDEIIEEILKELEEEENEEEENGENADESSQSSSSSSTPSEIEAAAKLINPEGSQASGAGESEAA